MKNKHTVRIIFLIIAMALALCAAALAEGDAPDRFYLYPNTYAAPVAYDQGADANTLPMIEVDAGRLGEGLTIRLYDLPGSWNSVTACLGEVTGQYFQTWQQDAASADMSVTGVKEPNGTTVVTFPAAWFEKADRDPVCVITYRDESGREMFLTGLTLRKSEEAPAIGLCGMLVSPQTGGTYTRSCTGMTDETVYVRTAPGNELTLTAEAQNILATPFMENDYTSYKCAKPDSGDATLTLTCGDVVYGKLGLTWAEAAQAPEPTETPTATLEPAINAQPGFAIPSPGRITLAAEGREPQMGLDGIPTIALDQADTVRLVLTRTFPWFADQASQDDFDYWTNEGRFRLTCVDEGTGTSLNLPSDPAVSGNDPSGRPAQIKKYSVDAAAGHSYLVTAESYGAGGDLLQLLRLRVVVPALPKEKRAPITIDEDGLDITGADLDGQITFSGTAEANTSNGVPQRLLVTLSDDSQDPMIDRAPVQVTGGPDDDGTYSVTGRWSYTLDAAAAERLRDYEGHLDLIVEYESAVTADDEHFEPDPEGRDSSQKRVISVDTRAPKILSANFANQVDDPIRELTGEENQTGADRAFKVSAARLSDGAPLNLTIMTSGTIQTLDVNGEPIQPVEDGAPLYQYTVSQDDTLLTITAADQAGNASSVTVAIVPYTSFAPVGIDGVSFAGLVTNQVNQRGLIGPIIISGRAARGARVAVSVTAESADGAVSDLFAGVAETDPDDAWHCELPPEAVQALSGFEGSITVSAAYEETDGVIAGFDEELNETPRDALAAEDLTIDVDTIVPAIGVSFDTRTSAGLVRALEDDENATGAPYAYKVDAAALTGEGEGLTLILTTDADTASLSVNGLPIERAGSENGADTYLYQLGADDGVLIVGAKDDAGNEASTSVAIERHVRLVPVTIDPLTLDGEPVELINVENSALLTTIHGTAAAGRTLTLTGTWSPANGSQPTVTEKAVTVEADGTWAMQLVNIENSEGRLAVEAAYEQTDGVIAGHDPFFDPEPDALKDACLIGIDTVAPTIDVDCAAADAGLMRALEGGENDTSADRAYKVLTTALDDPAHPVTLRIATGSASDSLSVTGGVSSAQRDDTLATYPLSAGDQALTVSAADTAGNRAEMTVAIVPHQQISPVTIDPIAIDGAAVSQIDAANYGGATGLHGTATAGRRVAVTAVWYAADGAQPAVFEQIVETDAEGTWSVPVTDAEREILAACEGRLVIDAAYAGEIEDYDALLDGPVDALAANTLTIDVDTIESSLNVAQNPDSYTYARLLSDGETAYTLKVEGNALTDAARPVGLTITTDQNVTPTVTGGSGTLQQAGAGYEYLLGPDDSALTITAADAAGNTTVRTVTVKPLRALSIDAANGRPIAQTPVFNISDGGALTVTGSAEPGEAVDLTVIVDNERYAETVQVGQDGAWAWTLPEAGQVADAECDALAKAHYTDFAPGEADAELICRYDLIAPGEPGLTAEGADHDLIGDTGTLLYARGMELTLHGVPAADGDSVHYRLGSGQEAALSESGARLNGSALDGAGQIAVWAVDAAGNCSPERVYATRRIANVTINSSEQLRINRYQTLTLTGTAEPGWNVRLRLIKNGYYDEARNRIDYGLVDLGEDGAWTVELQYSDVEALGTSSDHHGIELVYDDLGDLTEPKARGSLIVDSTVLAGLRPNQMIEGDTRVTGTADVGSSLTLSRDGEILRSFRPGSDGTLSVELDAPARVGEQYTFSGTSPYGQPIDPVTRTVSAYTGAVTLTIDQIEVDAPRHTADITGRARCGYDIQLTVNGEAYAETVQAVEPDASGNGTYHFHLTELPDDGEPAFGVRYADFFAQASIAGRDDATGLVTRAAVVDTKPPVIALTGAVNELSDTLSVSLNEPAAVTVAALNGDSQTVLVESRPCEAGDAEIRLSGQPLHGMEAVTLIATDAAGNVSDPVSYDIARSAQYYIARVALADGALRDDMLDATGNATLVGWIVAAAGADKPEGVRMDVSIDGEALSGSALPDPISVTAEVDTQRRDEMLGRASQSIYINGATCWRVTQTVDLRQVRLGTLTAEIKTDIPADDQIREAAPDQGAGWTVGVPGVAKGVRAGVVIALLAALAAAVAGLLVVLKRLGRLRDAAVDTNSRQSNLTIKKRT